MLKINNVTVYSKKPCSHCEQTKTWLKDHGVEFKEIDIYFDEDALEAIKDAAYRQAPVVSLNDWEVSWSGHQETNLEGHLLDVQK